MKKLRFIPVELLNTEYQNLQLLLLLLQLQSPSGLRQGSIVTRLLGLPVRIPLRPWDIFCVFYSTNKQARKITTKEARKGKKRTTMEEN
jgi:hypothetical protein